MSETTKTFVFPESGNDNSTNSIIAMLPALLQRQGVDPALIAMCTNRGAFGNNGLGDLIALVIIAAIFGNGSFGGGLFGNRGGGCALPNMINNDSNTQLLMQMLQRNGVDIQSLATMSNTSTSAITNAIASVSKDICAMAATNGQSFNQMLTAIMQSENALQGQLANCCCTLRDAITNMGFQNQLGQKDIQNGMLSGFNGIQVGMERGFSQIGYATAEQTCAIKQAIDSNGDRVIAKLEEQDKARMQREINALTAENASIKARAERAAEKADTDRRIDAMACKMPQTVTLPYSCATAVPTNALYNALGYGLNPFANGNGSIWS